MGCGCVFDYMAGWGAGTVFVALGAWGYYVQNGILGAFFKFGLIICSKRYIFCVRGANVAFRPGPVRWAG